MAEKTASNYFSNLENFLVGQNPALFEAVKIFKDLDQLEYELGLINQDDTTASKVSWWPVITIMGSATSGKSEFINRYLKTKVLTEDEHSTTQKVTVFQNSSKKNDITLPGTALDGDPRFPFYRTSTKIEQIAPGQGRKINSYLELRTCVSPKIKSKILINLPGLLDSTDEINQYLYEHVIEISDLVLVFLDPQKTKQSSLESLLDEMVKQQDPDKFIFIINQTGDQEKTPFQDHEITQLKKQLINLGMKSVQFFALDEAKAQAAIAPGSTVLSQIAGHKPTGLESQDYPELAEIEQRMENVNVHRSYQILNSLEKSIRANEEVIVPRVREAIGVWKQRSHFTMTVIAVGISSIVIYLKVHFGLIGFLFDPIIGPIMLAVALLVMIPIYLLISSTHAKSVLTGLNKRRIVEGRLENPAGLFEKNLTKWRMIMPIKEPLGWNKSIQGRLQELLDRSKNLFQYLNDGFAR